MFARDLEALSVLPAEQRANIYVFRDVKCLLNLCSDELRTRLRWRACLRTVQEAACDEHRRHQGWSTARQLCDPTSEPPVTTAATEGRLCRAFGFDQTVKWFFRLAYWQKAVRYLLETQGECLLQRQVVTCLQRIWHLIDLHRVVVHSEAVDPYLISPTLFDSDEVLIPEESRGA